jgi:hypothetical protein
VEAPEKPLPNRWLSAGNVDFTECFYQGAYQNRQLDTGSLTNGATQLVEEGRPLLDVLTTRQIIQLRGQRLFIAVDRVRPPDAETHAYDARYLMQPESAVVDVAHDPETRTVSCLPETTPGIMLRHFGQDLAYSELQPRIQKRTRVQAHWEAAGETVLVSLLSPHRNAADKPLREVRDLSSGTMVGFHATTAAAGRVSFAATRRVREGTSLSLAGLSVTAEMLLVVQDEAGVSGMVLGASGPLTDRRAEEAAAGQGGLGTLTSAGPDYVFADRDGTLVVLQPILRPIDPPTIDPQVNAFSDTQQVTITSQTPGVAIHYTLDGSEPTVNSPLYTKPVTITESCGVQARAFRTGQTTVPFCAAGTKVSVISFARFVKESERPARQPRNDLQPGLAYDYLESNWLKLFAWGGELPAVSSGVMTHLLDVGMRRTDGPFGLRCAGYLELPASGVYTFHAPYEYVHTTREAGYDLRLFVDGEEWDLAQIWHARGTWSIPLAAGLHEFNVLYADARAKDLATQRCDYWRGYPRPWCVWKGEAPVVEVSGPGVDRRPIPDNWLKH